MQYYFIENNGSREKMRWREKDKIQSEKGNDIILFYIQNIHNIQNLVSVLVTITAENRDDR